MNIALIIAGGVGTRMSSKTTPKQFLELHGKPIIIYTLEHFERHPFIDAIVISCIDSWINEMEELLKKYSILKVSSIVSGGVTGQESIYHGLQKIHAVYPPDSVILVHDGVRPMIDSETIKDCIEMTQKNGSAITVAPVTETIATQNIENRIVSILDRKKCLLARAPQCFFLRDIYATHKKAKSLGKNDYIDSASMMQDFGYKLYAVNGPADNIKITTPSDFYIFRAILDAKENSQILGI